MNSITQNYKIVSYRIEDSFMKRYSKEPEVVIQSPGRVNIIGEHTDYNDGFVLPAAIDYYMFVALSVNGSNEVNLHSIDYDEDEKVQLSSIERTQNDWRNLISGVLFQLKDRIGGFDLAFGGNIPEGAGVSSSAALCCGVAYALSELYDLNLSKWEIANIAQKSEHDFASVKCGIMDQFACMFGLTNHVLLLDCRSYTYEGSEVDLAGFKFLLINSNVQHSLVDSDYNVRKEESEKALAKIKLHYPHIKSYQDVTRTILDELRFELDSTLWKRALHVVSENVRVIEMRDALKHKKYTQIGDLLTSSHQSLKDYYEVTCEETDFLVDYLNRNLYVYGARQVGGGFGGCILALVKDADINEILEPVTKAYKSAFNYELDNIPIKISRGCHRIV